MNLLPEKADKIGNAVRTVRLHLELSQSECGVSQPVLNRIENPETGPYSKKKLDKVIEKFGRDSIEDLLREADNIEHSSEIIARKKQEYIFELGKSVRTIREFWGWHQKDLGCNLTVSRLETGKKHGEYGQKFLEKILKNTGFASPEELMATAKIIEDRKKTTQTAKPPTNSPAANSAPVPTNPRTPMVP